MSLGAAIEALVLEFPAYCYWRMTKALQYAGSCENHKWGLCVMREEYLLCQLRCRWMRTTDTAHGPTVFSNLLKQAGRRELTGIDQA